LSPFGKLRIKNKIMIRDKTKKEKVIKIITPPVASTKIELDLVKLTEFLVKNKKADWVGGILGGEFGYGCNFKNEVFEMRPFCYDDCECFESGLETHRPDCLLSLPNFKHFESGLEIRWYK